MPSCDPLIEREHMGTQGPLYSAFKPSDKKGWDRATVGRTLSGFGRR